MTSPTHDITLIVEGEQRFTGWTAVEFSRSLDDLADAWSVQAVTRWAVTSDPDIKIRIDEGDAVEFRWGAFGLLTGYVDEIAEEHDARAHSISLAGRSRAGDLVDCTALIKGAWRQRTAVEIARELVSPFGIAVVQGEAGAIDAPLARFAPDGDETIAEVLQRLAATADVRVITTPEGDVKFWAPLAPPVAGRALRAGHNIRRVSRRRSTVDRFSDYVMRIQRPGNDDEHGAAAVVGSSVQDEGVGRYRPLRMQTTGVRRDRIEARAEWERNTRAGRADEVEVEVFDADRTWLAGPGELWSPGHLVSVYYPALDIDHQLLIRSVALGYGADGYTATLGLVHQETYQPEIPPKPKKKKGGYSW